MHTLDDNIYQSMYVGDGRVISCCFAIGVGEVVRSDSPPFGALLHLTVVIPSAFQQQIFTKSPN